MGEFPAEAFRHSAPTAYDMAESGFSCHSAGTERLPPFARGLREKVLGRRRQIALGRFC